MANKAPPKPKPDVSGIAGEKKSGGFAEAMKETLEKQAAPVAAGEPPAAPPPQASTPSPLSTITTGKTPMPPRLLVYGVDGIGKSSFIAQAPNAIIIQTEDGLNEIACQKFPLATSYETVVRQLASVAREAHTYQTVAIDTLDWLERLIWEHVCRRTNVQNIEKAGGGFAKGYTFALDEWTEILSLLAECRERGMIVIMTAHAKVERFEDPENPAYDRYSPRLHKHADSMIREWVDATLFATRRLLVKEEGSGFDKRAIAAPVGADGGERILRAIGSPACVAKNRYSIPATIPFPKEGGFDIVFGYIVNHMNKES